MLKKLPDDFQEILVMVSRAAYGIGFKVYLVGGIVRDCILKRDVTDVDIIVEGDAIALAQRLSEIIGVEYKKHHAFGTASLEYAGYKIDLATARKEVYEKNGALPKVAASDFKSDLARRDFTINAMAISINQFDYGRLMDSFHGMADLHAGVIRILHDKSFYDDPTRILRAIRFEQRFGFKLEKNTAALMQQALKDDVFPCVHPHRWRDEMILLLKEPQPVRCIRRLEELCTVAKLCGNKDIRFAKNDWELLLRLDSLLEQAAYKFNRFRQVDSWLVYLIAMVSSMPRAALIKFMDNYGFRKGERMRVVAAKDYIGKVAKLNKEVKPHVIYRELNPLSFETIMYFYAYFYEDKLLVKNIEYFMTHLVNTRLKISGDDLKSAGIKPELIYGKILDKVLDIKISDGLATRQDELQAALGVYKKMKKNS